MSDTIYIPTPGNLQYLVDSLPPEMREEIIKQIQINDNQSTGIASWFPALAPLCLVIFAIFFFRKYKKTYIKDDAENNGSTAETLITEPEFYYYNGKNLNLTDADIISILQKHFVYYAGLSPKLKEQFLLRLKQFMRVKTFKLPKEETFKEVPVLLSAAAIQLTFGLDEYRLSWFQNIYVNSTEYFANDPHALRILAGNVEGETITVAWNHFLKGIENYEDGSNVGLHELAHALYYQHVIAENAHKKTLIKELDLVMLRAEVYISQQSTQALYSTYAFKNTQEFWAESIELFFEKPAAMQTLFPDLFCSIKELLNQDPLNRSNPLLQQ